MVFTDPLMLGCHVCGESRREHNINTRFNHFQNAHGATWTENIRYCNDRPDCIQRSQTHRLAKEGDQVSGDEPGKELRR